MKRLQSVVYQYNNDFKYDSSQYAVEKILNDSNTDNADRFFAYLLLSDTYKRLYDYRTTLSYLDTAAAYGMLTDNKDIYTHIIMAERALALFDINRYQESDSLMQKLNSIGYADLSYDYKAKIFMQQGYIMYLNKNYNDADMLYDKAKTLMAISAPCDLPIIYGKKIQLYGTMKEEKLLRKMFDQSMKSVDSCSMDKYKIYTMQMMAQACKEMGLYKEALEYFEIYGIMDRTYQEKGRVNRLHELDKKYKLEKKEQQIAFQNIIIEKHKLTIIWLISLIALIVVSTLSYIFYVRRKQAQKEMVKQQKYTDDLLENIEDERKRIASDLHDGVNHELLTLKNVATSGKTVSKEEIEKVINEIREVSRDLYPAMFENIGLEASVESLCERLTNAGLFTTCDLKYFGKLSKRNELQLYRIIQETLNNTLKHANANAAKVIISTNADQLYIEIKDNGVGFDIVKKMADASSFGLQSMMQRGRSLGGKLLIESGKEGTKLMLTLPLRS